MCQVYGHFVKKAIPEKDLVKILIIVIKKKGCNQVGYAKWELIPEVNRKLLTNYKFLVEKIIPSYETNNVSTRSRI